MGHECLGQGPHCHRRITPDVGPLEEQTRLAGAGPKVTFREPAGRAPSRPGRAALQGRPHSVKSPACLARPAQKQGSLRDPAEQSPRQTPSSPLPPPPPPKPKARVPRPLSPASAPHASQCAILAP